jgi:hypothetical protein
MSDTLLAVAAGLGGVLATRDATRLDVDPNGLAALVTAGELVHVRRGAYVLGQRWNDATPEQRLGLRTRAVLRARAGASEAASHQSALALHGLPLHGCPTDVVDLCGDVARTRNRTGLRVHPTDEALPVIDLGGCRALGIVTALVQVGLRHGRDAFVVPGDAALARGDLPLARVSETISRLGGSTRRAVRAHRWLQLLDAASESPGESRTRLLLRDLGYVTQSQAPIEDAPGHVVARVDFLVGDDVVIEFDGLVKYGGAEGRAALAAEKAREDLLRALGYEVVRLLWADLDRPRVVDAKVRAAITRAKARRAASA